MSGKDIVTSNRAVGSKRCNQRIILAVLVLPLLSLLQFLRLGVSITSVTNDVYLPDDWTTGAPVNHTAASSSAIHTAESNRVVVDVVSIGSQSRLDYARAQETSWGSHPSVRLFVHATELDDDRPSCPHNTTNENVRAHVQNCRQLHQQTPFLSQYRYFPVRFVLRKSNPAGWLCAQVRPGSAIAKIARLYHQQQQPLSLPDFLWLIDDDTMVQMDLFLERMQSVNSSEAYVWAGCLTILQRLPWYRFSPYGGVGTVWSKGALERLLQPIYCNSASTTHETSATSSSSSPLFLFSQQVCSRIAENLLLEQPLFREGMALYEFIHAIFQHAPNCFHSDWLVGHFVQYYYLSELWPDDPTHTNTSRLHPLVSNESLQYYYRNLPNNEFSPIGRLCALTERTCDKTYMVCHYVTPDRMRDVTATWMNHSTTTSTSTAARTLTTTTARWR